MGLITAMLVATPVFGLALVPPAGMTDANSAIVMAASLESVSPMSLLDGHETASEELEVGEDTASEVGDAPAAAGEDIGAQMQRRARNTPIHRALGIATWVSMMGAATLGAIQYYNMYGIFDGRDDNPCVRGNAVFGQGQCSGTPWLHLGAGLLTAALYTATYSISLAMPDPMNLDEGSGAYGRNLRTHKWLRWVHLGGMVAQMVLGFFISNSDRMGINRADDYGVLRALSTVHLGVGAVTLGALTWAAVVQL